MKLRTATLNAWVLPFGRAVPQRLSAIAKELPHIEADVIAFQEVWTPSAREALRRAGADSGLPHAWCGDGALGAAGLLLLSRWPMTEARLERFSLPQLPPRPDHADYYASKGFIDVRVETPGGPVRVVTTHLQARYARHVRHEYRAVRVGQVIELALRLDSIREPVVVLGDFNFRESDDEYRVLAGLTHLRDAAAETNSRQPTVDPTNPFRSSGARTKRIDYGFVRDGDAAGLSVRAAQRAFDATFPVDGQTATFSDHAGLIVDLELHDRPQLRRAPTRFAADLATAVLAEGRDRVERERIDARMSAGAGLAAGVAASVGGHNALCSRRRLLRAGLYTAAATALMPGVAFTMLAEVFAPEELEVYERLTARLAAVRRNATDSIA